MLYHTEVYLPEKIKEQLPKEKISLRYSNHAKRACRNDRYGNIPEMKAVYPKYAKVIEVETEAGQPIKSVYRLPFNQDLDICLVVLIETGLVKTVWLNSKDDSHKTLDTNKYAKRG
jgi:hypothetical protein